LDALLYRALELVEHFGLLAQEGFHAGFGDFVIGTPYSAIPDRVEDALDWIEDIERLSAVARSAQSRIP
jgi:hypothetical protein